MNSLEVVREFLGYSTVINYGVLVFTAIILISMRGFVAKIHGKMFTLTDRDLSVAYFQFLAQYKIAIFIFNLVPYVALCMMS